MAEISIRPAKPAEAKELTQIAIRSKAHWGYSQELIDIWAEDLCVTSASCDGESTWVIEVDGQLAGFGELLTQLAPAILDDLFIDPTFIGQGLGGRLLQHLITLARDRGISAIEFDAEPHAVGFYERYGAHTIGERSSTVVPGRTLPITEIRLG
ncbi:MAG: GNAT family N-acetyltransferase [Thermomicrobiales bacterium]|nr:GNAT family N-acetyltransferase [Thermomicrobiales bacterium]